MVKEKLIVKGDYTPEQMKHQFYQLTSDIEARIITAGNEPKTMQDIPALFEGSKEKGTGILRYTLEKPYTTLEGETIWKQSSIGIHTPEVVKTALWIAQKYDLIPKDTPLRQVWYHFIKLALQKSVVDVANADQLFSDYFLEVVRDAGLWYSDFNVKNEPVGYKTPEFIDSRYPNLKLPLDVLLFPNIIIAMEKESYFNYLKNFANLIGAANYSAGGMSQGTLAETIIKDLHEKYPKEDFRMYAVTDYDPAGFNIGVSLGEHFNLFSKRLGFNVDTKRVAPMPSHYTTRADGVDEIEIAKYDIAGDWRKQSRWMADDKVAEREDAEIEDGKGMEVESLPAVPLLDQLPAGMTVDDAVGQARMRLIIFNKILEDTGGIDNLDFALRNLMEQGFILKTEKKADEILAENSGIKAIDDNSTSIWTNADILVKILAKANETERDEIKDKIVEWKDETIDEWGKDNIKLIELEDELRRATVKNEAQSYLREIYQKKYPEIPKDIKEWEIATGMKKKINNYKDKVDEIVKEMDELVNEASTEFNIKVVEVEDE